MWKFEVLHTVKHYYRLLSFKLFRCIQVHWWLKLSTGVTTCTQYLMKAAKQQHTCHKCVSPPVKITKTGWLEVLLIVFKTANPDCVTQTYFRAQQLKIHHSYATNVLCFDSAWLVRSKKVLRVLHENYDLSDLQSPLVFFAAEPNYMFLEWWVAVSF